MTEHSLESRKAPWPQTGVLTFRLYTLSAPQLAAPVVPGMNQAANADLVLATTSNSGQDTSRMGNKGFSPSELREVQELLDAAGQRAERLREILISVTRLLVEQQFLLARSSWRGHETGDHREHLSTLYPEHSVESLDDVRLLGQPITQLLLKTNREYHSDQRTPGGAGDHAMVAAAQGGDFCMICGQREKTVVDHIVAVNRRGPATNLANMQILCEACNSAKKNPFTVECYGWDKSEFGE